MLSDDHIPEEGVDRKYATAVQRALTEYWAKIDQAYRVTKNPQFKLPTRCWRKLEAVRKKSYVPIVPEGVGVFTGGQQFSMDELENIASNRYAIGWNFKKSNYIRQLEGATFEDLHDPKKSQACTRCP